MPRLRRILPPTLALICFLVALWTLPAVWCRLGAGAWFRGERDVQTSLARTVAMQTQGDLSTKAFQTGSARFDGEWLFGTHTMAGIGFCQIVLQHPETKQEWTPKIEYCIRKLLSTEVREFDRVAWNENALETLDKPIGHAAYLG